MTGTLTDQRLQPPTRLLTRRNFLLAAAAAGAGTALYSSEIARHEISIVSLALSLPNLPDPFHNYRIAQISDIHFDEFTEPEFLARIVRGKPTGSCVLWVVEPQTYMKGIGRGQGRIRIKAKDLVEQDCLDAHVAVVTMLTELKVGLIPRQTEAAFEVRIGGFTARNGLRCTVKTSKARPGLMPSRSSNKVSLSLPRITVALALGSS